VFDAQVSCGLPNGVGDVSSSMKGSLLCFAMTRVEMGANAAQVHSMRTYAELGYDLAVSSPKFWGK
ncbi:MAG: hypothetical protein IJ895_04050, partial [Prevotella sp.]|nr:hypothetical protein [Prevotella sp.]